MKFLDSPPIARINACLNSGIDLMDYSIHGRLEAYSCKLAANDKKIKKDVEQKVLDGLGMTDAGQDADFVASSLTGSFGQFSQSSSVGMSSSSWCSSSPLGNLQDSSTRKLLVDLILTLNSTYPDYDFSAISPDDFCRERDHKMVINSVNQKLARVDEFERSFTDELWSSIEQVINMADCQIYSYIADPDDALFSSGKIWSFNYFFFNKKSKKILFFASWMSSKKAMVISEPQDVSDDEYDDMTLDDY